MTTTAFRALVLDAFDLTGRGTVVAVEILDGVIRAGDTLRVPFRDGSVRALEVTGVDFIDHDIGRPTFHATVGLSFRGIHSTDLALGSEIAADLPKPAPSE